MAAVWLRSSIGAGFVAVRRLADRLRTSIRCRKVLQFLKPRRREKMQVIEYQARHQKCFFASIAAAFSYPIRSEAIMNKTRTLLFAGLAAAAMFAGQAWAMPVNQQIDPGAPPPPGWILNLGGLPVAENPSRYVQYTAYFLAAQTTTHITFAMRDDTLAVIFLDSIAVADVSSPGANLIRNGGFEDGTVPSGGNANAPVNWRYANPHSAPFESTVSCGGYGQGGSGCAWGSGTDTAYDLITQSVATVVGDEYQLSFWAFADASASGHFWKELNGACCGKFPQPSGDAFDIVAYAGNLPAGIVPEPTALGMFGFGALLIGGFLVLRRREQPRARGTRIVVSGVRAQSVHYLTRTSTAVMLSRPPPSSAASSR